MDAMLSKIVKDLVDIDLQFLQVPLLQLRGNRDRIKIRLEFLLIKASGRLRMRHFHCAARRRSEATAIGVVDTSVPDPLSILFCFQSPTEK